MSLIDSLKLTPLKLSASTKTTKASTQETKTVVASSNKTNSVVDITPDEAMFAIEAAEKEEEE